jgi:hypothetical protein
VAFPLGHACSLEFAQYHLNHALPTMEFPDFDGSSPKLWFKKCNNYFDMYAAPDFLKSRTAYMHFSGNADFWAQSLDYPVQELAWPDLCKLFVIGLKKISIISCLGSFFALSNRIVWLNILRSLIALFTKF